MTKRISTPPKNNAKSIQSSDIKDKINKAYNNKEVCFNFSLIDTKLIWEWGITRNYNSCKCSDTGKYCNNFKNERVCKDKGKKCKDIISEIETMKGTWGSYKKGKPLKLASYDLCNPKLEKEVLTRFCELKNNQIAKIEKDIFTTDIIYRIRHENKFRLFGIMHNATFYVLWHDPWHKFYPTEKK